MIKSFQELKEIKHLPTWASTMNYIYKNGIFKYLDNYHTLPILDSRKHSPMARAWLKKHHPIYANQIRLWEILHNKDVVTME
jgi:hypothetical protein